MGRAAAPSHSGNVGAGWNSVSPTTAALSPDPQPNRTSRGVAVTVEPCGVHKIVNILLKRHGCRRNRSFGTHTISRGSSSDITVGSAPDESGCTSARQRSGGCRMTRTGTLAPAGGRSSAWRSARRARAISCLFQSNTRPPCLTIPSRAITAPGTRSPRSAQPSASRPESRSFTAMRWLSLPTDCRQSFSESISIRAISSSSVIGFPKTSE